MNHVVIRMLTGSSLSSLVGLRTALDTFHNKYHVPHVVISSLLLKPEDVPFSILTKEHPANPIYSSETLLCLCSSTTPSGPNTSRVGVIAVPKIRGYFSGVGDLFSALVLAHFDSDTHGERALETATARAVNTTHSILVDTQRHYVDLPEDDRPDTDTEKDTLDAARRPKRMKARELRIIQALDRIRSTSCEPLGEMIEWKDFWKI